MWCCNIQDTARPNKAWNKGKAPSYCCLDSQCLTYVFYKATAGRRMHLLFLAEKEMILYLPIVRDFLNSFPDLFPSVIYKSTFLLGSHFFTDKNENVSIFSFLFSLLFGNRSRNGELEKCLQDLHRLFTNLYQ